MKKHTKKQPYYFDLLGTEIRKGKGIWERDPDDDSQFRAVFNVRSGFMKLQPLFYAEEHVREMEEEIADDLDAINKRIQSLKERLHLLDKSAEDMPRLLRDIFIERPDLKKLQKIIDRTLEDHPENGSLEC